MIYLQSGKYFYKKTNNGKMTRISKEVYMENIDKIEEASGGTGELHTTPIIKKSSRKNPRIRSYKNMPLEEGGFAFLIRLQNEKFIQTTKYFKINNNDIIYNQVRHQFSNSECGVYSMNFIIRLLHGETFDDITENITKDTEMNACRKSYFRNN